jgi:hypothetical protein
MLLRVASPEVVDDVGWDFIRFRFKDGYWHTFHRLELADPLGFTRAQAEPAFGRTARLDELLDALESLGGREPDEPQAITIAKPSDSALKENIQ